VLPTSDHAFESFSVPGQSFGSFAVPGRMRGCRARRRGHGVRDGADPEAMSTAQPLQLLDVEPETAPAGAEYHEGTGCADQVTSRFLRGQPTAASDAATLAATDLTGSAAEGGNADLCLRLSPPSGALSFAIICG
jgi:hypothetical protein